MEGDHESNDADSRGELGSFITKLDDVSTTYKHQYKGHYSSSTIKSANFFGPCSEFVVSGSDDARVFIWSKDTTDLLAVLEVCNFIYAQVLA